MEDGTPMICHPAAEGLAATIRAAEVERAARVEPLCKTCCRPFYSPFRRYDKRGKVTEGCIDACHGTHLIRPSESARWHDSKLAKDLRRKSAKRLKELLS